MMFSDNNLTGSAAFIPSLIKRAKKIFHEKLIFHVTQRKMCTIAKQGWNTQIVQIFSEELDVQFDLYEIMQRIIANTIELSHWWVFTHLNDQEPSFYDRLFDA